MGIEDILYTSLAEVLKNANNPDSLPAKVPSEYNIIDNLESMSIVEMLLEVEEKIEQVFGTYITLADEDMFDYKKSPLKKWSIWLEYVKNKIE